MLSINARCILSRLLSSLSTSFHNCNHAQHKCKMYSLTPTFLPFNQFSFNCKIFHESAFSKSRIFAFVISNRLCPHDYVNLYSVRWFPLFAVFLVVLPPQLFNWRAILREIRFAVVYACSTLFKLLTVPIRWMEKLFVEALGLFSSRFFPIWSLIAFLLLRTIPVEVVIVEHIVADSNSDDDKPIAHDAEQRPHAVVVLGHLHEPPHACLVIEHLSFVLGNNRLS